MAGKFEQPITIEKAMDAINSKEYLIPGIQRKFTWDKDRICRLFDSLMRKYPINSFMFWEVRKEIYCKTYLYPFVEHYRQRFNEEEKQTTPTRDSVIAVIDGQQRLNSLYIALIMTLL